MLAHGMGTGTWQLYASWEVAGEDGGMHDPQEAAVPSRAAHGFPGLLLGVSS